MIILVALCVISQTALAKNGMIIESVKSPLSGYGKWVISLNDSGKKYECRLKNLNKTASRWVMECPEGNYRFGRPFDDRFKIVKEGEKSGYISKAGYFIHTQLHEIRLANKKKLSQWLLHGSNTVLTATQRNMKEWKAHFFSSPEGKKQGEMVMRWAFSNLKELVVKDSFPATTEAQKRDKFLVVLATIYSSIASRY
jgi:hypothetical protein